MSEAIEKLKKKLGEYERRLKEEDPEAYEQHLEGCRILLERIRAEQAAETLDGERRQRIYYQSIVYELCLLVDRRTGAKPGEGVVCGNARNPSDGLRDAVVRLLEAR